MKKPLTGRRIARLGACAAAAGLVAVGMTATPALADSDQLWIAANPYELVLPNVVDGTQQAPAVTLALGLYHDNPSHRVTDGRLTVDISGLAGIAEVTWPENCAPAGTTAVCSLPEVPVNSSTPVKLQVRAVAGAADGATGRISYQAEATTTAEGGELTAAENGTDFRVASGPDLVLDRPAPVTGVTPGSTVPVGLSVANHGNRPAEGVQFSLYVTRGLELTGLPQQCTGTPIGEGTIKPITRYDCAFADVVPPGGTFTLPEPPSAKVAPYALAERVDIGVQPGGGAEDLQPEGNGAVLDVTAVNTADFAVRGARLTAEAGRTVTVPVTFRNRGPAWVANLTSGDPVADVDVTVPRGATATAVPDACEPRTADGGWWESEVRTGAPRYLCRLPMWVAEQQTVTFPFALRIDTVVTGAKGAVVLKPPYGDTPLPFDPNRKNDQAKIVLNPAG
ncbi:hypothetical protein ACFY7C_28720 [Streptomyces sp. NPDC012769]|uniref:hypothetical protein n=1 Tax=Streptomyces sp. NPDC012769 TaxID=3364848 RepID=UPI0036961F99